MTALALAWPKLLSLEPFVADSSAPPDAAASEPTYRLSLPARPETITVADADWWSWAMLDRDTGRTAGSANAANEGTTTESMIKPWIVADYLRRVEDAGEEPSEDELEQLTLVIIDSNDPLAEDYYQRGGSDDVVQRLVDRCGLTDVIIEPGLWGMTMMTALDAVRYGACLADGRAAGPKWTPWLLDAMKRVRGTVPDQDGYEVQGGRWGIIDALPAALATDTSIKNGWTEYYEGWHVNCLAVHPDWVLVVMMIAPTLDRAAAGCARVAAGLVVDYRQ